MLHETSDHAAQRRARGRSSCSAMSASRCRSSRIDAYSWQLSGGLRQRAMIAMALSCQPRLLIADEPTTAIDVTTQAQILALLRDLQRKYDTAIIFITHDLGVIAQMANYVVVMYLGRVMEEGPVDEIFHAPQHPYTRALLRSIPSMHSETRTALPIISGALPHPFNRPPGCPFHPRCEDIDAGALRHRGSRAAHARAAARGELLPAQRRRPNRHDRAAARRSRPAEVLPDREGHVPPRHRPCARGGRCQLHREGGRDARPRRRERLRQDHDLALHSARDRSDRRAGAVSHARRPIVDLAPMSRRTWRRCAKRSR